MNDRYLAVYLDRAADPEPFVDLADDLTLSLDGTACRTPECDGTIIAYPVPANDPARIRCRECGAGNML